MVMGMVERPPELTAVMFRLATMLRGLQSAAHPAAGVAQINVIASKIRLRKEAPASNLGRNLRDIHCEAMESFIGAGWERRP